MLSKIGTQPFPGHFVHFSQEEGIAKTRIDDGSHPSYYGKIHSFIIFDPHKVRHNVSKTSRSGRLELHQHLTNCIHNNEIYAEKNDKWPRPSSWMLISISTCSNVMFASLLYAHKALLGKKLPQSIARWEVWMASIFYMKKTKTIASRLICL